MIPTHRGHKINHPWAHSEVRAGGDPRYHVIYLVLGAGLQVELSRALSSKVLCISASSLQIILFYKDAGSLPFGFNWKKSFKDEYM